MIVSHSRRFIFIKTVKTAGTSLEIALSRHCGPGDIITPIHDRDEAKRRELGGTAPQNFRIPLREAGRGQLARFLATGRTQPRFEEHSPAWIIRDLVGRETWEGYFKFTVARHPFDRCVSRYFWSRAYDLENRVGNWENFPDFDQFLRYRAGQINENWALYTEQDRVMADFVARYENLEADLAVISSRIGLDHNIHGEMRAIRTKEGHRPRGAGDAPVPTDAQKELIRRLCAAEMAHFGYE